MIGETIVLINREGDAGDLKIIFKHIQLVMPGWRAKVHILWCGQMIINQEDMTSRYDIGVIRDNMKCSSCQF